MVMAGHTRPRRPGGRTGLFCTVAVATLWCSLGIGAFFAIGAEGRSGLTTAASLTG